ncbi:MAG TPA: hypothetical protein VMT43_14125 [Acidimicrobiales bacterium]|nr:hypothetical protein [Acidimicrobiales bacterium]
MTRAYGDRGQVGGIEVLPFGVLIFVVGALLVTNAWGVVDARIAADAAAREAVRAYVEAPDGTTGAAEARRAALATIAAHGRRASLLRLSIERAAGAPFERCVPVTVEVRYPVPAVVLPWIGGYGHAFDVRAHHTERIDPFRNGLSGAAPC